MKKTVKVFRKIAIALVGLPLLIVGLILIPLPGPGILISFVALLILSQEFEWAQKHADRLRAQVEKIIANLKTSKTK